tara:strand:+ start:1100 stop:2482 length:1383 start_codon:yes stop_codon:yes gene_type:complete
MYLFNLNSPNRFFILLSKIKLFYINKYFFSFFITLFFSFSSHSLTFKVKGIASKIVETKSTAFSAFKVIKLQRGKTDLIFPGDHYKFFKDKLFLFRGVCFQSNEYESTWLLYNHFSKGTNYQEILLGQKVKNYLVPKRIRNLLDIVKPNIEYYEKQFIGKLSERKKDSKIVDNGVIKVEGEKDLELNPNEFVKKVENIDLKNSLEQYKFTFDLGPIIINTNPNTINSSLGISLSCLYCTEKKYFLRYTFFHRTEEPRRVDYGKNEDLISRNFHELFGHYEWVRVFENISFYSRLYGNRAKTSDQLNGQDIYSPEFLARVTPFAVRFHLLNKLKNVQASIGIGPSYSFERFQFNDNGTFAVDAGNKLRWSFNFFLNWEVTKIFTLSSDSWFHPLNSGEGGSFDVYDSGPSRFNASASLKVNNSLSISFLSELFWNGLQKRREDLPSSNFMNSLKLHYSVKF